MPPLNLPTFPSTWYHPVFGAKTVESLDDYQKLGPDWRDHPGKADMDRTETEAGIVIAHNLAVKQAMALKAAQAGDPPDGGAHTEFAFSRDSGNDDDKVIVRNSVQAQQSLDEGKTEPL
jgi:hypothetical protein